MKNLKFLIALALSLLLFSFPISGQNVGINTATPAATLDINGDIILRAGSLNIPDAIEQELDVNSEKFSFYRVSGPTTDFDISGIDAGVDGRIVTLLNVSTYDMILHHLDPDAAPGDQVVTGTGGDLTIEDRSMVTLMYDGLDQQWIVKNTSKGGTPDGSMGWDTSGTNLFYQNNVGIGTNDPVSPLTIQTDVNETGMTQIGGPDSITLATRINDISASIGTSSDNIFSLNSGGSGKVHIWPDGDVVIGNEEQALALKGNEATRMDFDSKVTVLTPLGESGFTHIGGDNEMIVDEAMGMSSASIGTKTNNTFRIKTDDIGRLHIWYDGRVHIGNNTDVPNSQFTVFTPPNSFGISHTTTGGIVLESHIGAASAGFGTYSNNEFRLVSNSATVLTCAPSGNVGIGTTNPPRKLSIYTDPNSFGFSQISSGGIELASHIGGVSASFGTRTNNKFRLVANDISIMTIHPNGNVGIGLGTNDEPGHKLEVNGAIRSKEVIVESINWPDYVFDTDYELNSLDALEKFISENHHLPNVPSAKEVEDQGQHLGELQSKMMEKIEELTLHILELNKRIEVLEHSQHQ